MPLVSAMSGLNSKLATCLVENVGGKDFRSDAAGQILNALASETPFDGGVVAMGLCVALF